MVGYIFLLSTLSQIAMAAPSGAEPTWDSSWRGFPELASILRLSPTGKELIEKAKLKDADFISRIQIGEASFTESTFSRTYSLLDGHEQVHIKNIVTINSKLKLADAVVDLAHELVHFLDKEMLDPYKTDFEMEKFIRLGIEGKGGELSALATECKVAFEMEQSFAGFPKHELCAPYKQANGKFNWEMARKDYYALGTWYREASEFLVSHFPEMSDRRTIFSSSYAKKPYPLALFEEYEVTRNAACENNRKKYRMISAQTSSAAQPDQIITQLEREKSRLKVYDDKYCRTKPKYKYF